MLRGLDKWKEHFAGYANNLPATNEISVRSLKL